jgi:hypothetical protein
MAELWALIKDNLPAVVGLIATAGFFVGLWQYSRAQRWKRAEFISRYIKDLEDNKLFRRAMKILDFRASYIELDDGRKVFFDHKILTEALPHESLKPSPSTPDEEVIRLAFCDFFDGLDRLQHFVEAGLIKRKHLDPYLPYWFGRFTTTEYKPQEFIDTIWTFIDGYEYAGVRKLAKEFKFQPPDKEAVYEKVALRQLANAEKTLGLEHPDIAGILENYAALLRKMGRDDEAKGMEAHAQAIRAKHAQQNPQK